MISIFAPSNTFVINLLGRLQRPVHSASSTFHELNIRSPKQFKIISLFFFLFASSQDDRKSILFQYSEIRLDNYIIYGLWNHIRSFKRECRFNQLINFLFCLQYCKTIPACNIQKIKLTCDNPVEMLYIFM